MEFAHIKREKNFTVDEMIEVVFTDARYPSSKETIWLSLKDAHDLVRDLNNFISDIPY